jgi:carboxyl-terminal processing protease
MRTSWRRTAILLFSLSLLGGGFFGAHLQALDEEARESMRLYTELVTVAHDNYGADVAYKDLVYASVNGMMRALDPHSSFLPPRAYADMRERQQSSFYGLGILVGLRDGRVTVITPIEGGPASRLGIRAGDIIDTINGESTESMNIDDAVSLLTGPKDTSVDITLLRQGIEDSLAMTVIRDEIPLTTVRYAYMFDPETAYMRITDFNRGTGKEVADNLERLRGEGMKRLLLDLRNNGGGLLDQAIEVADQFVPKGTRIVETRGRTRGSHQTYFAEERYVDLDVPVVVLVNSGTASAAEILSGAIQDHDVGLVAGTPTWGKGLVQTVYTLSYGAGVALTTARYYTPSGRLIQRDYSSFYDYYSYTGLPGEAEEVESDATTADKGPVFKTDLGREVYGGGGITPDVLVEPDEISPFLQLMHARSAFFRYGIEVHDKLEAKGGVSDRWKPTADVAEGFKAWLLKEEIAKPEDVEEAMAIPETRDYALRQIRAEVFNAAFGQNAWHRVIAEGDTQVQKALDLFDRSAELLASRQELQSEIDRQAELKKN